MVITLGHDFWQRDYPAQFVIRCGRCIASSCMLINDVVELNMLGIGNYVARMPLVPHLIKQMAVANRE